MTDVRLKEFLTIEGPTMDWFVRDIGLLDDREELATAVRVALGTDSLSGDNDILPDPDSTDRRGWWGDLDAEAIWGGWPIGCKNWLLSRSKITGGPSFEGNTLSRAQQYTVFALQPFVDRHIASQIVVVATRTELERIEVQATIYRGPLPEIDLRYQLLWEEQPFLESGPVSNSVNTTVRVPYASLQLTTSIPVRS